MVRFHLITLFPEVCEPYLTASIVGRARKEKKIGVTYQNPRDFVTNKWGKVDERPYGGGPGMVMTALPVVKAVKKSLSRKKGKKPTIVWFTPGGKQFTHKDAERFSKQDDVVFVCGRYEGIDARAISMLRTFGKVEKFSVGPYILTGAELPALTMIDVTTRRIPGVLGKDESVEERRVASRDVYTRPETILWEGKKLRVPKVLQGGNHAEIEKWKKKINKE